MLREDFNNKYAPSASELNYTNKAVNEIGETLNEGRLSASSLNSTIASIAEPARQDAIRAFHAEISRRGTAPVPILTIGSSTTADGSYQTLLSTYIGAERDVESLNDAYTNRAAHTSGVKIINGGISGTNAETYVTADMKTKIAAIAPRIVIHMIGSNDAVGGGPGNPGRPASMYRDNLVAVIDAIDAAQSAKPVHILVHSYERMDIVSPTIWAEYRAALFAIAATKPERIAAIDISREFAVTGLPTSDPLDLIIPDGIHATTAGYRLLVDAITDRLALTPAQVTAASSGEAPVLMLAMFDAFTDADNTLLSAHAVPFGPSWQVGSGAIAGNRANVVSGGGLALAAPLLATDVAVEGAFVIGSGSPVHGVVLRGLDANNRLTTYCTGDGIAYIGMHVSGALTFLAQTAMTALAVGTTHRIRGTLFGSKIALYVDGVKLLEYTLTATQRTTIASWKSPGIRSLGTGALVDNFVVMQA